MGLEGTSRWVVLESEAYLGCQEETESSVKSTVNMVVVKIRMGTLW